MRVNKYMYLIPENWWVRDHTLWRVIVLQSNRGPQPSNHLSSNDLRRKIARRWVSDVEFWVRQLRNFRVGYVSSVTRLVQDLTAGLVFSPNRIFRTGECGSNDFRFHIEYSTVDYRGMGTKSSPRGAQWRAQFFWSGRESEGKLNVTTCEPRLWDLLVCLYFFSCV